MLNQAKRAMDGGSYWKPCAERAPPGGETAGVVRTRVIESVVGCIFLQGQQVSQTVWRAKGVGASGMA